MLPASEAPPALLPVPDGEAHCAEPSCSGTCGASDSAAARELRERLADLLGPVGASGAAVADQGAAATVARFGGERSCFHRFLHAKRQSVVTTEQKLRKTVEWRKQVGANEILESSAARKVYSLMEPVWPEKVIGCTPDGSPISYFDTAQAVQTCQLDIWTEDNVQTFYVAWMEHSLRLQREGRQRHGPCGEGNNMPASVVVYNLKDLRLSHVVRCMKGLAALVKILGIIDEHYPENLRKAVIINVPCIFYKMVWPLVQKALDARTLANVHLSDGEGREMLSKVFGVSCEEVDTLLEDVLRDS